MQEYHRYCLMSKLKLYLDYDATFLKGTKMSKCDFKLFILMNGGNGQEVSQTPGQY